MFKHSFLIFFFQINLMLCGFSQSIRYNKIFPFEENDSSIANRIYTIKYLNDSIVIAKFASLKSGNGKADIILKKININENISTIQSHKLYNEFELFIGRNIKIQKKINKYFSIYNISKENNGNIGVLYIVNEGFETELVKEIVFNDVNTQISDMQLFSFLIYSKKIYYTGYIRLGNNNKVVPMLIITDLEGNILLNKYIDISLFTNNNQAFDLTIDTNKGCIYLAINSSLNLGWSGQNMVNCSERNTVVTHITKLDTLGNLLKTYKDNQNTRYVSKILSNKKNEIIYCGAVGIDEEHNPPWCIPKCKPSITKLDSNLNFQWNYICDFAAPTPVGVFSYQYNSLINLNNDDIIAGGYIVRPSNSEVITQKSYRVGIITKLNSNGQVLWERFYEYLSDSLSHNRIISIETTSNGDILAAGDLLGNTEESPNYQNSWIMRLDSMGCLIPGCHITSVEPEKEPEELDWEIKEQLLIYPNPATDVVYLMLQNYEEAEYILQITDMNGRIVQSQTQIFSDTQYILDVSNWRQGMYFAALFKNGEKKEVKKIVKQ